MNQAIRPRTLSKLGRLFLPREPSTDSREFTIAQRKKVFAYFDAGSRRLEGAGQLHESGAVVPALVLFRDGALLLVKAHLLARDANLDVARLDTLEGLHRFASSLDHERVKFGDRICERLTDLSSLDSLAIDRLAPSEASEIAQELSTMTRQLRELVEPMTLRQAGVTHNARLVVLISLLVVGVSVGLVRSLRPSNIAFHKKATASGSAFDTTPGAAVDGLAYGSYGFHSENGPSPWLKIDLGRKYHITEADIYGRHDCCYEQSVPLAFEVSDDGETFRQVATRERPFEMLDPWNIKLGLTVARYVRLRTLRQSVLVLSEVEVYGRPAD